MTEAEIHPNWSARQVAAFQLWERRGAEGWVDARRKVRWDSPGFIYFARIDGIPDVIKMGFALDVPTRMRSLAHDYDHTFIPIGCVAGLIRDETRARRWFRPHSAKALRASRETFRWAPIKSTVEAWLAAGAIPDDLWSGNHVRP